MQHGQTADTDTYKLWAVTVGFITNSVKIVNNAKRKSINV